MIYSRDGKFLSDIAMTENTRSRLNIFHVFLFPFYFKKIIISFFDAYLNERKKPSILYLIR